MSNEVIGIKVLFNPVTDTVSLLCLQGQLGLGEDRIHISTPCLLSYSQPVTQIQAGDSYSAAVTGESRIQPDSQPARFFISKQYHFGLKALSTIKQRSLTQASKQLIVTAEISL